MEREGGGDDHQGIVTNKQQQKQQQQQQQQGIKKGPWKPEEDLLLIRYVETYGEGRWATVSKRSGLMRGGKSCRLRWKNYLRPNLKRGGMSKEEEDLIIRMHKLLGNRWSLIAGRLPGRTDNEVKNYWNTHLRIKMESEVNEPRLKRRKLSTSSPETQINGIIVNESDEHNNNNTNTTNNNNNNIYRPQSDEHNNNIYRPQSDDEHPYHQQQLQQLQQQQFHHQWLFSFEGKSSEEVVVPYSNLLPLLDSGFLNESFGIGNGDYNHENNNSCYFSTESLTYISEDLFQ